MFHVEQFANKCSFDGYFDVVVVGGGHAGIEASAIAAQIGVSTALLSMKGVPIGEMPCNPAIGGVGKGQVVREVDALGGLMGKLSDRSAIQYRTLNESKGAAVQSTRIQSDKEVYSKLAEQELLNANVTIIYDTLKSVELVNSSGTNYYLLECESGKVLLTSKLVITTGTYMDGLMHIGEEKFVGGTRGKSASKGIRALFKNIDISVKRYKTGTPARIFKNSVDYSKFHKQESDPQSFTFHWNHTPEMRFLPQSACYLTRTNIRTMNIIRDSRERSPLFNGQISGIGPRYCPSIEDKAYRYPDRNEHHVFIEPEGVDSETLYPNGLSTSLPKDVQENFLRSIEGLENCRIKHYAYAVEYDAIRTTFLRRTLEHKDYQGLYFAGQVNGTSGYEEAAGQGIIAGINAAQSLLGKNEVIFSRQDSYLGILAEDIVTREIDEPYRLFTSRNENRLQVREDNVYFRMISYRRMLNLHLPIDDFYNKFESEHKLLTLFCHSFTYNPFHPGICEHFSINSYGDIDSPLRMIDLLRRPKLNPFDVLKKELKLKNLEFLELVIKNVAVDMKYGGYIDKSIGEIEKASRIDAKRIDWQKLCESSNISYECKQRIQNVRPETFSELKKIAGIRTATIVYVASNL